MKVYLRIFFLFSFCLTIDSLSAQTVIEYDGASNYGTVEAPPGTYQLLTVETKVKEIFTYHIATYVQSKRKQNQTIILKIGNYSYVKIPSFNEINNPNFTPYSEGMNLVDYSYIFPNYNIEK